jgi:hypothetical protein
MRRICTSRAALGAVTAALALTFGVFAGGAAQASTTVAASGSHLTAAHATLLSVRTTAAGSSQPGACYFDQECVYDSGWMTYGDGGCEADITVGFEPWENIMNVSVEVQSPYLFAGCTAVAAVHFSTFYAAEGQYDPGWSNGDFWGYACSETDFTCHAPHADPGTWWYTNVATGIPNVNDALDVSSVWVVVTT